MIKNLFLLAFLLFFFACEVSQTASIHNGPVPLENETDWDWKQGWLIVPENRLEAKANLIELPFVLSQSPDSSISQNPPILVMSGGPGSSSLHMANGLVNMPWSSGHDLLIMEQRGTRYAKPYLHCPEIDSLRILGWENGLLGNALDSLNLLGVQMCYERLQAKNIDLNGYHTLESVEDIEALRKMLKLEKMILYGMSYSCNLMTAYAQKYPQNTAGLVLDSPLPHRANYDEEALLNIDSTLIKIIKSDTGSKTLYYQWVDYLATVKDSVFDFPLNEKIYHYTKNELIDILLFKMSAAYTLPETVPTIRQIIAGNHQGMEEVIKYYLQTGIQAKGMRFSVWIGEELPEEKEERIKQQAQKFPWLADYPANNVSFKTATIWRVNSIYEKRKWPEAPYLGPALILSGQFDPWTPEWYGSLLLSDVPKAQHLVYPGMSHLPGFKQKGSQDIKHFLDTIAVQ